MSETQKHSDDEPVIFAYTSDLNISFNGEDEIGYTWGAWREMSRKGRDDIIQDKLNEIVEIWIKDDERD